MEFPAFDDTEDAYDDPDELEAEFDIDEDPFAVQEPDQDPPPAGDSSEDSEVDLSDTEADPSCVGTTWRQVKRKTVKDLLLRDYTLRMAAKWRLSRAQVAELNEMLMVYITFRIIDVDDIVLESSNKIGTIKAVQFMPGAFCIVIPDIESHEVNSLLDTLSCPVTETTRGSGRPISLTSQVRKRLKKI